MGPPCGRDLLESSVDGASLNGASRKFGGPIHRPCDLPRARFALARSSMPANSARASLGNAAAPIMARCRSVAVGQMLVGYFFVGIPFCEAQMGAIVSGQVVDPAGAAMSALPLVIVVGRWGASMKYRRCVDRLPAPLRSLLSAATETVQSLKRCTRLASASSRSTCSRANRAAWERSPRRGSGGGALLHWLDDACRRR